MPGKIFLSCGQRPREEGVAKQIKENIENFCQGFQVYVAREDQSTYDAVDKIIKELESSDYFIFIDFIRNKIFNEKCEEKFAGSLFANQELALVRYMRFSEVILLQQEGIELDGMARYLLTNARRFSDSQKICEIILDEIKKRNWLPSYSRHLLVKKLRREERPFFFGDHAGRYFHYVWFAHITNQTEHMPATDTVARLINVKNPEEKNSCPDRALLKWAGQLGFERLIMPGEEEHFSIFSLDFQNPLDVYLFSAADMFPRKPIIQGAPGIYILTYQVMSPHFPILKFMVELKLTGNIDTTEVRLLE